MRLAERCRISDEAYFKAVALFDSVVTRSRENPYHLAIICLYMFSKFLDLKYLDVKTLIKGISLTSNNDKFPKMTVNKVHELEWHVMELSQFSISSNKVSSAFELFEMYFMVL